MSWFCKAGFVTLYHGTNIDLSRFELNFSGQRDWGDMGIGVYLGGSPSFAYYYAEEAVASRGGRPRVYEVRADISKTADLEDPSILEQVRNNTNAPFPKYIKPGEPQSRPREESQKIAEYIQSLGYDSACQYSKQEFVVYDPSKLHIIREYPSDLII